MKPPFSLPYSARRVLLGTSTHEQLASFLAAHRPDLEVRGAPFVNITPDQLTWADTYVGFKRPPAATSMGAVRWVHCTGAGVDSWLAGDGLDPDILLTRTPESFGPMIAEWTAARVLAFQQQLLDVARAQREHRWAPREVSFVAGTRALVLGTGDIGSAIATLLKSLGCDVIGVSRTGTRGSPAFRAVHTVDKLASLVGGVQWIVITLPITAATHKLFSRELMSHCRGAVLLNAGRGAVVDQAALPEALDKGWLRGAALDVFEAEPLPADSPLWRDERVMISPHISGITTIEGAGNGFLECLTSLEQGVLPRWTVDRERGY